METTVKQRLINFIKYKELSQKRFEGMIGAGNGYVKNISRGIGADKQKRIKEVFPELNMAWLLLGEGNMLVEVVEHDDDKEASTPAAVVDFRDETIARLQAEVERLQRQTETLLGVVNRLTGGCSSNDELHI